MNDIRIAVATPDEAPFIMDTWARSLRKAPNNRRMPTGAFHAWNRPRMIAALGRSTVYVALDDESPGYIVGWIAAELRGSAFVAHYCYVRQLYQQRGVAKALLRHAVRAAGDSSEALYTNRTARFVDEYMRRVGFFYKPALSDGTRTTHSAGTSRR